MRSYLQFITTPTADTPGTTLLLHFDNKRYLFGHIAEGTQRASIQLGTKLLKVSEIFLSGKTEWSNNGGLLGMILTLADAVATSTAAMSKDEVRRKIVQNIKINGGDVNDELAIEKAMKDTRPRMTLFGTKNLNYTVATARRFIFRKGLPIDGREVREDSNGGISDPEPVFVDMNIKVWAMAVNPDSSTTVKSPRKRSFDAMHEVEMQDTTLCKDESAILKAKEVVTEMFDSTWRMDALFETPLKDVRMPAKAFIRDPQTNKLERYKGPLADSGQKLPDINVLVRKPWPGAMVKSLPPTEPAKEAVSYIVKNHPQRGKFNVKRAKALGLNDPRTYSKLTRGESVDNDKGETITADMVLEPGKPGGGAAIVDLPTLEYVEPLLRRPEWKSEQIMQGVEAYIWLLGPGVIDSPALKHFMEQNSHVKHVISSTDTCHNRYANDSAAAATIRMSKLDPIRYSIPIHDNQIPTKALTEPVQPADRGHIINLTPTVELKTDQALPLVDIPAVVSEMSPQVLQLATLAQDDIEKDSTSLAVWADRLPRKDTEIVTLGTGSALPSKYRNVSATLVRVPGWGCILLDCGENTLGQLKRVFPPEELEEIIKDLRLIWISHMHADHHLGTVSVIKAWYETVHKCQPRADLDSTAPNSDAGQQFSNQKRLSVVSDRPMLHWLWEYSQMEDYGFSRIAPLCISADFPDNNSYLSWFLPPSEREEDLHADEHRRGLESEAPVSPSDLGLESIRAVPVQHCLGARAVCITLPKAADEMHKPPFKISYSGDCRPNYTFGTVGRNTTVCIHEATFDDELQGDAQAKNHSTTSEALSIASRMRAKAVVLTHFSQRYQKIPVLEHADLDSRGRSRSRSRSRSASRHNSQPSKTDTEMDAEMDGDGNGDEPLLDPVSSTTTTQPRNKPPSPSRSPSTTNRQNTIKMTNAAASDMKICIAFDYTRVKVGEIAQMEKFTPALLELFADEDRKSVGGDGGEEDDGGDEKSRDIVRKNGDGKGGGRGQSRGKGGGNGSQERQRTEKKKEKEKAKGRRNN